MDIERNLKPRLHWRERWFAGLTAKGFALIAAFSLLNALRRNINSRFLWEDYTEWLIDLATITVSGLLVALSVVIAVVAAYNRARITGWRRFALLALVASASCLLGAFLLETWEGIDLAFENDFGWPVWRQIIGSWLRYAPLAFMFAGAYLYFRRRNESAASMRGLEADRAALDRRVAEARLSVLQAQIEPHFLFNTLANVKRLYRTDAAAGGLMLDNLMRYLAVALPRMRESESTLGREIELAQAYLDIHRVRMGQRLAYSIDVDAPLLEASMPPVMILTLVENAIKHGLNPLTEGGAVDISARVDAGVLEVRVADTGRGFVMGSGAGTGLANIRAQLAALYGLAGTLVVTAGAPKGVVAIIGLPHAPGQVEPGAA